MKPSQKDEDLQRIFLKMKTDDDFKFFGKTKDQLKAEADGRCLKVIKEKRA